MNEGTDYRKTALRWMKRAGLPVSEASLKTLLRRRNAIFQKEEKKQIRLFPAALPLLKELKRKGYRLGLVTGTPRPLLKRLLGKTVLCHFSVVVTPEDVPRGKPHPEPYRKAVEALGVSRKRCVVVENAASGIRSAHRAGLFCIALPTSVPRRSLKEADRIVPSLRHLKPLLGLSS